MRGDRVPYSRRRPLYVSTLRKNQKANVFLLAPGPCTRLHFCHSPAPPFLAKDTIMPKNIILCSDGTGNSGGKGYGPNVWRLYLAVDHHPYNTGKQVVFYDDGVGSQDFKFLKAIGGAFGWGISDNLREIYAFLMLHYEPGDKIFLFGFSRGAFTIRTLGNMIRYCGVADCDGMSANDINKRAAAALKAYKYREPSQQTSGGAAPAAFKKEFGRF